MEQITWLVLGYQVPVTPSKKRVYVWRKLKELGATYFRPGVAMLPKNGANLSRLETLSAKIIEMGGESTLAELRYISPKDEQKAIAEFRQQSRKEYKKVLQEIVQLRKDVSSGALDKEKGLEKSRVLERRLSQIKSRDYFMSLREPEVSGGFYELLHDMAFATTNLSKHIAMILNDR